MKAYAVRRLNPFGGVVQVVGGDAARAISMDGARWEIQVLAEAPNDCWGSLNRRASRVQFFRFGVWSANEGLSRVPINPIMDVGAMIEEADELIAALSRQVEALPFPLTDDLELWQLDHIGRPMALLMSAVEGEDLESLAPRHWSAAPLHDRNLGRERREGENPVADDLERLVRRTAGSGRRSWFRREAPGEGDGVPLSGDGRGSADRLPAAAFPELPLCNHWEKAADQALVARWISWAAPRLLCLPYLAAGTCRELEAIARQSAAAIADLWRLYPASVDRELVKTARVETQLRKAAGTA